MTHDHVLGVGALVHDVDLGDDSDGPDTLGVKFPSKLKAVACCHICISWDDDEDDGSRLPAVLLNHVLCDLLDVLVLVRSSHRDTGDTRQIDECEIRACVRVND